MANGDSNGNIPPAKIILSCLGLSITVMAIGLTITTQRLDEHAAEINEIRADLVKRTDERYRASDAARDFRLVEFRFERMEKDMDKCMDYIEQHKNATGYVITDFQGDQSQQEQDNGR